MRRSDGRGRRGQQAVQLFCRVPGMVDVRYRFRVAALFRKNQVAAALRQEGFATRAKGPQEQRWKISTAGGHST